MWEKQNVQIPFAAFEGDPLPGELDRLIFIQIK